MCIYVLVKVLTYLLTFPISEDSGIFPQRLSHGISRQETKSMKLKRQLQKLLLYCFLNTSHIYSTILVPSLSFIQGTVLFLTFVFIYQTYTSLFLNCLHSCVKMRTQFG